MSDNKLATKADLQEMYNRIYPYLGGMPEMLANKFSKGDLYSTEEKMIGQWTNGKPLYSKTINSTTGNTTSQTLISNLDSLNIDTMVSMTGKLVNRGLTVPIPAYLTATGYVGMYYNPSGNSIIAFVGSDWYNQPVTITLQYTKTTDTAISIGEATDYSTEEKIVGTWIDEKPIYQKTINCGALPSSTQQMRVPHNISNIDKIIKYDALALVRDNGSGIMVNGSYINNPATTAITEDIIMSCFITRTDVVLRIKGDRSGMDAYVTIQYTKTV